MADPTLRVSLTPTGSAGDIDALATAVDAVAGTDTVVVDRGQDLVVSIDLEVTDADPEAVVAAVLAAVDVEVVGDPHIEGDPVLNAPANGTLDISDGNILKRTYTPILTGPDARVASVEVTTNEIPSGAVVISRGNPGGHDSQKSPDGSFDLTIGPAVAGDATGSPHDVIVEVTDSNGRTATDTIQITVQA